MTEAYPDICNFLTDYVHSHDEIESFIIDSEIVAFDAKTMRILPFQVLSTRARKNVEAQ
jgi:DNA ligase-1